jgi:hypothetical protein
MGRSSTCKMVKTRSGDFGRYEAISYGRSRLDAVSRKTMKQKS